MYFNEFSKGTRIEAWMPGEALKSCSAFPIPSNSKSDEVPSSLFNGMIAPFQFMAVRAALWYQGEGNERLIQCFVVFVLVPSPFFLPSCFHFLYSNFCLSSLLHNSQC